MLRAKLGSYFIIVSRIFMFQSLLHCFFHYEFLNFSGDGGWELGNERDVFWNFEMGYFPFTELSDLLLIQGTSII